MVVPMYAIISAGYYASLSYEYEITERHTIGCQIHSNYASIGMWEFFRHSYNMNLSYRYYFLRKEKFKSFVILEPGYYKLRNGGMEDVFWSNNYTVGTLVGIRINFGSSKKWFYDFSIGGAVVKRDTYKQVVDYPSGSVEPALPKDQTHILPRMIVEVGFRF